MSKHIYCIAGSEQAAVSKLTDTHNLCPIHHKDISAIVKETPFASYSSQIDRKILIRSLAEHQSVIEGIFKDYTVVPIKFGTIARDDGDVMEILDTGYTSFKGIIDAMHGKAQVEVLALWNNLDEVIKRIGKTGDITRFKEEAVLRPANEFQSHAVELGRIVKRVLDEENSRIRDEVLDDLKKYALNIRAHDLIDDRMIMNMAFLIQRCDMPRLYEEIDRIDARYNGDTNFKVIGPLPPYSFFTMEIKRLSSREIKKAMGIMRINRRLENARLPVENEIKSAYRTMLKKIHPDKNPEDNEAQKKFEMIKKAYETLMECVQGCANTSICGDVIVIKKVA